MNHSSKNTSACGCCEGLDLRTPESLLNDPGLEALAFRVGRHGTFKESMLRQLSESAALRELTTREDDDHTIALLDAWAVLLDVLTFYQERIVQEGYLRTSRERLSLLELSRHISYRPKPGVAAGTWLSFFLDESPGAPTTTDVPVGTKVQSIPEQHQKAQIFETTEAILARTQWNAMRARQSRPAVLGRGATALYLQGTNTQLQVGDTILIVGQERILDPNNERWDVRTVSAVSPDAKANRTLVEWREGLGHTNPLVQPGAKAEVYVFRQRAALFGHNAPDYRSLIDEVSTNYASDQDGNDWKKSLVIDPATQTIYLDGAYPKVLTGSWLALSSPAYVELYRANLAETASKKAFTLAGKSTRIKLDTAESLEKFGLRDTVVFAQSEALPLAETPIFSPVFGKRIELDEPQHELQKDQTLIISGELVTQLQVAPLKKIVKSGQTEVVQTKALLFKPAAGPAVSLTSGEVLTVAGIPEEITGGKTRWRLQRQGISGTVDAGEDDLLPYRLKSETGAPEAPSSLNQPQIVSEQIVIRQITASGALDLKSSLEHVYWRPSVQINANVVWATHGETKLEVLGSGDGTRLFQLFKLKQKPLTYTASAVASGAESTLEIRVNDILWKEAPTFYQRSGEERIFVTRIDDDGTVKVQFGNGITGGRLPSGVENVRARYRVGTGFEGLLNAHQLTMLMSPQLGLKSVTNPVPSTGADEPESMENIRENAPLTVLTLDRVVSQQDYQHFANAYAGIGKARADVLWKGEDRTVHLTVASANEGAVDTTLTNNLLQAINNARHEHFPVVIQSFAEKRFNVIARVKTHPDHLEEKVLQRVRETLVDAFNFRNRAFGQGVTPSEVIAVIQSVEGVIAVDLDKLGNQNPFSSPHFRLLARPARWSGNLILPAELLLIDPDQITLSLMNP